MVREARLSRFDLPHSGFLTGCELFEEGDDFWQGLDPTIRSSKQTRRKKKRTARRTPQHHSARNDHRVR